MKCRFLLRKRSTVAPARRLPALGLQVVSCAGYHFGLTGKQPSPGMLHTSTSPLLSIVVRNRSNIARSARFGARYPLMPLFQSGEDDTGDLCPSVRVYTKEPAGVWPLFWTGSRLPHPPLLQSRPVEQKPSFFLRSSKEE